MKKLDAVKRINELHGLIVRNTVPIACEIGGLLEKQKEIVKNGNWQTWVKENLNFSATTAKRYMAIYRHENSLTEDEKTNLVGKTLDDAYGEATKKGSEESGSKERPNSYFRLQDKVRETLRRLFASQSDNYQNSAKGDYLNQIIKGDVLEVMEEMAEARPESIHLICTSVPYNCKLFYGPNCDDNKAYQNYLDWLGEFVSLCNKLLVRGGRLVINCDNLTNGDRDEEGEFTYKHALDCDLRYKVRQLKTDLLEYQDLIWYKYNNGGAKITCWGSPFRPNFRNCKEHIIIWAKGDYTISNPDNVKSDLTSKELQEWSFNVWDVHPNTNKNCPHPCTWPTRLTDRFTKLFSLPGQTVLDPFCGSGTTCVSANNFGRNYIGIDQNGSYCQWAKDRVEGKDMDKIYHNFMATVVDQIEDPEVKKKVEEKIKKYAKSQENNKETKVKSKKDKTPKLVVSELNNIPFEKRSA